MDPEFLRAPIPEIPPVHAGIHICSLRGDGWVRLNFDINENGTTENIRVIAEEPPGRLSRQAFNFVRTWGYEPYVVNGQAMPRRGLETVILYDRKNYCD